LPSSNIENIEENELKRQKTDHNEANLSLLHQIDILNQQNDFLTNRIYELNAEIQSLSKKYNSLLNRFENDQQILKDNFMFPKSVQGLLEIMDFLTNFYSIGIFNSAKKVSRDSNYNRIFDCTSLNSYSHRDWLLKIVSHLSINEDGNENQINFDCKSLNEALEDASLFIYFINKLATKCAAIPLSSNIHETADTNIINCSKYNLDKFCHLCNIILSSFFELIDHSFVNAFALICQILFKFKTCSKWATNVIGKILPGGVNASYLDNRTYQATEKVGKIEDISNIDVNVDIIGLVDNCAVNYKPTSCENKTKDTRKSTIWSNAAYVACYPPLRTTPPITREENRLNITTQQQENNTIGSQHGSNRSGEGEKKSTFPSIQSSPKYAPSNWKSIGSCDENIVEFGYSKFPKIHLDSLTHLEIMERFKTQFLNIAIGEIEGRSSHEEEHYEQSNLYLEEDRTHQLISSAFAPNSGEHHEEEEGAVKYKYCYLCEKQWPSKTTRSMCDCGGSSNKLVLISPTKNKMNSRTSFRVKQESRQEKHIIEQSRVISSSSSLACPSSTSIMSNHSNNTIINISELSRKIESKTQVSNKSSIITAAPTVSIIDEKKIDDNAIQNTPLIQRLIDKQAVLGHLTKNEIIKDPKYVSATSRGVDIYHPLPPILVNPSSAEACMNEIFPQ